MLVESIGDSAFRYNTPRPFSESGGVFDSVGDSPSDSVSLDIYRDFPAVPIDDGKNEAKVTEKVTPDKSFTLEEKKAWKREQDKILQRRENAARSIVLGYINASPDFPSLDPMAAAAAADEEKLVRRSQCRSFLKCMRKNGHAPVDLVRYDDGSVVLSGLWRCGSLWQCPRCSSIGLWRYSRRLCELLEAIQKENCRRRRENLPCLSVLFCTFTAPHAPGDSLGGQMRLFSDVWSKVLDARPVRRVREEYGMVGSVRCYDHTCTLFHNSEIRDWHTHFHNLLVFDPMEGESGVEVMDGSAAAARVSDVLFDVWSDRVRKHSGRECSQDAFLVEVVDLVSDDRSDHAVADYASKVFTLPGYMTKSQKRRRGEEEDGGPLPPFRSLAPFDLLDAYSVWEDRSGFDYAAAWIEYCVETKGFHRVQFSRGLERRFKVGEKKEEKEACPVCRHTLPGPVADVALSHSDVLSDLREAVVADDAVRFYDVLKPWGLAWAADEVADGKPMQEKPMNDAERALCRYRLMRSLSLAGLLSDWEGVPERNESLFYEGVKNG